MNLVELKQLGEDLGYDGTELQTFVSKQQELARSERAREREAEKDREETKRAQAKAESEMKAADLELEKQKTEQLRLQLQLNQQNTGNAGQQNTDDASQHSGSRRGSLSETRESDISRPTRVKGPKLTPFDEKDDIDSYLVRFEKYATTEKWERGSWAVYLSALLRGKALDVYARMPVAESSNYDKLKRDMK